MKPSDAKQKDCKVISADKCTAEGCMHWKALIPENADANHKGWGYCTAFDVEATYRAGFLDGITAYAINRNGQQEVGSTGTTLNDAKRRVEDTWNYVPRRGDS